MPPSPGHCILPGSIKQHSAAALLHHGNSTHNHQHASAAPTQQMY